MLGHKNVSTTEIYAKMNDQQKMQTVNRITLKEAAEEAEG
jgi:site-specific recombinase XerD